MKITADDGTVYEPKTRTEAYRVVRLLIQDTRRGPKPGLHVQKTPWGTYRFRYVTDGRQVGGPARATPDEAAEDYRRHLAGIPLAPRTVGLGTRSHSERCREAHLRAYQRAKAASPDGRVHLGPATCGRCGVTGHKANACPASGWTPLRVRPASPRPRKATPAAPDARGCAFCGFGGHKASRCAKRIQALRERVGRAA